MIIDQDCFMARIGFFHNFDKVPEFASFEFNSAEKEKIALCIALFNLFHLSMSEVNVVI